MVPDDASTSTSTPAGPKTGPKLCRIDLPCLVAGFSPPPCGVHLRFEKRGDRWLLHGLTAPGRPTAIARWLEPYHPASVRIATGIAPRFLRGEFDELPAKWNEFLTRLRVRYVELTAAGTASIFVEGSDDHVEAAVENLGIASPAVRTRPSMAVSEPLRLTPRQQEVLSAAVALGYYELPHRLHLRALAERLGLSVGAVSELLRRGEAGVINRYVDSLAGQAWRDQETGESLDAALGPRLQ